MVIQVKNSPLSQPAKVNLIFMQKNAINSFFSLSSFTCKASKNYEHNRHITELFEGICLWTEKCTHVDKEEK